MAKKAPPPAKIFLAALHNNSYQLPGEQEAGGKRQEASYQLPVISYQLPENEIPVTNYRTGEFIRHTCEQTNNSFKPASTNYQLPVTSS